MNNIFNSPQKYVNEINKKIQINNPITFNGKSMAVVFLTKFCPVKCSFCFFRSKDKTENLVNEENEFTNEGVKKLIDFLNYVNLETLELSGGGEPFEKIPEMVEIIKKVKTKQIILVTSGYWADNEEKTASILSLINNAVNEREDKDEVDVILRLSADKFHGKNVDLNNIKNVINYFENTNKNLLRLRIHTMINDGLVENFINLISDSSVRIANNKFNIKTKSGCEFELEKAKMFYSNLKVNLLNTKNIDKASLVFFKDIEESPLNNYSIYKDKEGQYGLDFLINYAGNVSTWGNYQMSNAPNIYCDDKQTILNKLYKDIISYSFLHLNYYERDKIVREINPNAADRAIATNVRDFSGMSLLEESDTKLYYQLIVLKKYIEQGVVTKDQLKLLSPELSEYIETSPEKIKDVYNTSSYDILKQICESNELDRKKVFDTLELVRCGHYKVKNEELLQKLKEKYVDKSEIIELLAGQQERLVGKFFAISDDAKRRISENQASSVELLQAK